MMQRPNRDFTSCRSLSTASSGHHLVHSKHGTMEARVQALQRRLSHAEAAEQRLQTELLSAYGRAEAANRDAAAARQLQQDMQVRYVLRYVVYL